MKCEEIENLMLDYLDNKLDSKLNQDIEKHLENCERCLDEFTHLHKMLQRIDSDEIENPDESLRINFYHMLHNEIQKTREKKVSQDHTLKVHWYDKNIYRIAAGIALLLTGTITGMIMNSVIKNPGQSKKISDLQTEVASLKKTAMFTMLKDESSSQRIQAVDYADEINLPDENIINALVKTLNNDRNVNVRMSAAYALAKFADQRAVCDSLVKSLSIQTDPILQVTLINILVERREKSALKAIQQIIRDKNTLEEVKIIAESGANQLI
jgi:hypothetical protein